MPVYCAVNGCRNYHRGSGSVSFFRFPSRKHYKERRKAWIRAVNRKGPNGEDWEPGAHSRVCGAHFITGGPSLNKFHTDYVPTVFPYRITQEYQPRYGRADVANAAEGLQGWHAESNTRNTDLTNPDVQRAAAPEDVAATNGSEEEDHVIGSRIELYANSWTQKSGTDSLIPTVFPVLLHVAGLPLTDPSTVVPDKDKEDLWFHFPTVKEEPSLG